MDEREREDGIAARQDGRVYPVGRVLRSTFDADNHDTLGSDLTGLMIDLSRVPFGPDEEVRLLARAPRITRPAEPATPPDAMPPPRGWLSRLTGLIARR